jgi:hypothetical protein
MGRPRVAFGVCHCDIVGANATSFFFFFFRQELAALAIQLGFASRVALFQMFRKCYFSFLVTFFIVSILIAGMASKQGSINFGQKKKAPEPDNLFVNYVSVPGLHTSTCFCQKILGSPRLQPRTYFA